MDMRINAVSQSIQAEMRKIEHARKNDKAQNNARVVASDHTQFSKSAQTLSDTKSSIDTIAATLSSQTDVRTEKIAEVQEKIKNGYYDSPEFIDKLAEKLISEFGIKTSD
jgi:anti-sigma28 factor (negative regulator of flagellin synthesis)